MWENFVFLVIFDTCDVVHNWFISLLPPIVLDNLFDFPYLIIFPRSILIENSSRSSEIVTQQYMFKGFLLQVRFTMVSFKGSVRETWKGV